MGSVIGDPVSFDTRKEGRYKDGFCVVSKLIVKLVMYLYSHSTLSYVTINLKSYRDVQP
jgi:hypothetical protein